MDRRISLLRVVACFMVILLHVSAENFHTFGNKWWAANFFDSLARACVPIFFMISGATLLSKSESLGDFFRKRFVKTLPPLIFWSVFYLWWLEHNGVQTGNWIVAILSGPTMFHLWYFYAIIGLYAITPILRKFYQNSTRAEQASFIGLWLLVASVYPLGQSLYQNMQCVDMWLSTLPQTYHLFYLSGYAGYLLLGAFIVEGRSSVKVGLALFSAGTAGTIAGTYFLSTHLGAPCEYLYTYLSPFVVLAACGLFMAIMALPNAVPSKPLAALADCSLGIYCVHVIVIDPIFKSHGISATVGNPWITSMTTTVGVFLVSFVVIFIARKIKPFRYVT
ncbi:acyltransferase [Collimonas sp.]|jgi:surface polysaccharide O-acyltransferase-like enzyme|uniref:acyltransferase n=1 Tax=Collimonas sp. TaxID=1963772 RepID=UPI002B77C2BA|nr:acyltransferase family protein [Collimonas sp.]HWW08548.1 acyltransferase family protein [Collimonas sp.]